MRGTELFFVRHGEHDFTGAENIVAVDPARMHPGHKKREDHGLTSVGRDQALYSATKLRSLIAPGAPVVIFSSPKRRARETANPISEVFGVPVSIIPEFEELRLGEGSPTELWEKARQDIAAKPSPDSESFCELSDRVMAALVTAIEGKAGHKIIFVTHGGVMESLFYSLLQIPIEKNIVCGPILSNGAILHFVYDEFMGVAGFRMKI